MSDKNFKIRPTTWPKEYTFEEFKMLNPNINENILINYYNKYLFEYAEDRSRHINHFNDTKDNLSEEIRLLKEERKWNYDGDQTVGPTGGGRQFRSPLNPNVNALHFDGVDDVVPLNFIQEGRIPADGTLKPYKGLTFAMWINTSYIQSSSDTSNGTYYIGGAYDSQAGYNFTHTGHRLIFSVTHDSNISTGTDIGKGDNVQCRSQYRWCQDNTTYTKQQFREDGWHHIIGTWDGKKQILYVDGNESNASGTLISPTFNNTDHSWDVYSGEGVPTNKSYGGRGVGFSRIEQSFNVGSGTGDGYPDLLSPTDYQTTSGSIGSLYYREVSPTSTFYRNNHLTNASIGTQANTDVNGAFSGFTGTTYSGSIAEVAMWDEALDATTINELWHNGISGSAPKFDLSYPGYNNGENNHNHAYDIADEGLNYTNVGRYAGSLQGWWRLEEGTGVVAQDSSGKNRNGDLINSPEWDPIGSYTPSLTQGDPS
tara:strand:- start:1000 stop:2448 length:1449 start_codon:yes stop_codon:yes gene_type:complete